MWHAMVVSLALLVAGQGRAEVKAEKAAEAGGWLAPTRIRLDFRDRTARRDRRRDQRPGAEDAGAFAPNRGADDPASGEIRAPPRRYSLVEPEPVTFWEAVDRVARATQTWPASGNMPVGGLGILLAPASADRGFAYERRGLPRGADRDILREQLPVRPALLQPARPGATEGRRVEPAAGRERQPDDHGRASPPDHSPGRAGRPRGGRRPGPQSDPGRALARVAEQVPGPQLPQRGARRGSASSRWTIPASGSSGWRGASRSRSRRACPVRPVRLIAVGFDFADVPLP